MMSENRIQAVIFDLDDTLLDWSQQAGIGSVVRVCMERVRRYLVEEGYDLPDEETFYKRWRETVIRSWDEAKKTWTAVNFSRMLRQFLIAQDPNLEQIDINVVMRVYGWQPFPNVTLYQDAVPVLETVRDQGYKIGLVTNSMQPMWMRDIELKAYKILDYFDARITSGDTGFMKPHPAIYHRVLSLLDAAPERSVFIGDRPANDIAGANAVGMVSVLMSPVHVSYELDGVQPDYTITRLKELLPILAQLEAE